MQFAVNGKDLRREYEWAMNYSPAKREENNEHKAKHSILNER
jgi:hypothetical protein